MRFDWSPLRDALSACRRAGVTTPVWWRDDDAVEMTSALDRLSEMSSRFGIPVHLAIIPARMNPALPAAIDRNQLLPVVHGWAHADHSLPGQKKNEFLTPRPGAAKEAQAGFDRMKELFDGDLLPMFVPPWNRIGDDVTEELFDQGYRVLSTYRPRKQAVFAGLHIVNTHIDPIAWHGTRDLVDPVALIGSAASQLQDRAEGRADHTEPFGLLTHHLVHTPSIWQFIEEFWIEMQSGGAFPWSMEKDI